MHVSSKHIIVLKSNGQQRGGQVCPLQKLLLFVFSCPQSTQINSLLHIKGAYLRSSERGQMRQTTQSTTNILCQSPHIGAFAAMDFYSQRTARTRQALQAVNFHLSCGSFYLDASPGIFV